MLEMIERIFSSKDGGEEYDSCAILILQFRWNNGFKILS